MVTFVVIFSVWLMWSGFFDPFHLLLGLISSMIVVLWTGHLFAEQEQSLGIRIKEWIRFEQYSVWLLWQIIQANIQVLKLAFHPNISTAISPKWVTFKTTLKGDVPLFILAQSITLTPGTVTVKINKNQFTVHAINELAAKGVPGEMENKVKHIFQERIK
jgi:multicomponent Na+:H+ antiporter subunit E